MEMIGRRVPLFLGVAFAFGLSWFVTMRFGNVTRAYISGDGHVVLTAWPDFWLTAFVWLPTSLLMGMFTAIAMAPWFKKFVRAIAAMLIALLLEYGAAMLIAAQVGMAGFFGLLGYHGDADEWSPTRASFYACPLLVVGGALLGTWISDSADIKRNSCG